MSDRPKGRAPIVAMRSIRMRDGEVTLRPNELFTLVYLTSAIASPKIVLSSNLKQVGKKDFIPYPEKINPLPGGSTKLRMNIRAPSQPGDVGTILEDIRTPNNFDSKHVLIVRVVESPVVPSTTDAEKRQLAHSQIHLIATGYLAGTMFDMSFWMKKGVPTFTSEKGGGATQQLSDGEAEQLWRIADDYVWGGVFKPVESDVQPMGNDIGSIRVYYKNKFARPSEVPKLIEFFGRFGSDNEEMRGMLHLSSSGSPMNASNKSHQSAGDDDDGGDQLSRTQSSNSIGEGSSSSDLNPSYSGLTGYDMPKLWALTKSNKVQNILVKDISHFLARPYWDDGLTPRAVLNARGREHKREWAAIMKADLDFPILVIWNKDEATPSDVVDGLHRLALAHLKNDKSIKMQIVTEEQMEAAKK